DSDSGATPATPSTSSGVTSATRPREAALPRADRSGGPGASRSARAAVLPYRRTMSRPSLGASLADGGNRRRVPYLRARGWRPTTVTYTGYGCQERRRSLARVLLLSCTA